MRRGGGQAIENMVNCLGKMSNFWKPHCVKSLEGKRVWKKEAEEGEKMGADEINKERVMERDRKK